MTKLRPRQQQQTTIGNGRISSVTARFLLDLFYYLIMCVYMCLYVINCLCVYFGLGLVDFGAEGQYGHFRLRGILVILRAGVK